MKSVEIVKIGELIPIYKEGSEANSIQVARICELDNDTPCQFNIIVGKGLYNIGDKVVYIQPDYCIPNNETFNDYYEPFGDAKKSKLGKKGRIKAVKFNFYFEDDDNPIYSNGIILPLDMIKFEINEDTDLEKELMVIKYVSEDSFEKGGGSSGLTKGDLPSFLYATDEPRIELKKSSIDKCFEENEVLSLTIKRDGSSATIYCKQDIVNDFLCDGVCSRNQEKKLEQKYNASYIDSTDNILTKWLDRELNKSGFYNEFTKTFFTEDECIVNNFTPVEKEVRDAWVDTVKENDYLVKLHDYCVENNLQLAMRGELIGQGNKGSGNKLNQDAKLNKHIVWFGVDDLSSGHATRINYSDVDNNLKTLCDKFGFLCTEEILEGIFSYFELIKICNNYFKQIKEETGQIIEGIVIRSKYSNKLSTKYINPEYDAKSN